MIKDYADKQNTILSLNYEDCKTLHSNPSVQSLSTFGVKTIEPETQFEWDYFYILSVNSLSSWKFARAILKYNSINENREVIYREPSGELMTAITNHYNWISNKGSNWLFGMSRHRMWATVHYMLRLFHSDEKLAEVINRWVDEKCDLEPEYFIALIEHWEDFKEYPLLWATGTINTQDLNFRERIYR